MSLSEKVRDSIERLKSFAPRNGEGYYLAFSGGKDSVVCKRLLDMAGLKYDAHYRVTSVDPPELVRFIREKYPDVECEIPRYSDGIRDERLAGRPVTMWNLIPYQKIPPTRVMRYCCKYLKESGGDGRMVVTGVRWAESTNRKLNQGIVNVKGKKAGREFADDVNFRMERHGGVVLVNDNDESRRTIEQCYQRCKTTVNAIVDWTDAEVWEFIKTESIPYCGLYDCGFTRLGCIGCPMAQTKGRERQFLFWPKFKGAYIRAFDKMVEARTARGMSNKSEWQTGRDVFNWWMEYDVLPGQIDIFDIVEEAEDFYW